MRCSPESDSEGDLSATAQPIPAQRDEIACNSLEHSHSQQPVDVLRALLAHDAAAPIATLRGLLTLIKDDLDGGLTGETPELLASSIVVANQLHAMHQLMLSIATAGTGGCHRSTVLIDALFTQASTQVGRGIPAGVLRLSQRSHGILVECDENRMTQVLACLLDNAVQFIDPHEADPYIEVDVEIVGSDGHLRITDNGKGVPEDLKGSLFEPLVASEEGGRGMGLYLARCNVQQHNGRLELLQAAKPTVLLIQIPDSAVASNQSERAA
jgi:K+-sensing histidine kinase KdpD